MSHHQILPLLHRHLDEEQADELVEAIRSDPCSAAAFLQSCGHDAESFKTWTRVFNLK